MAGRTDGGWAGRQVKLVYFLKNCTDHYKVCKEEKPYLSGINLTYFARRSLVLTVVKAAFHEHFESVPEEVKWQNKKKDR